MALGLIWSSICLCAFISVLLLDRMGAFSSKNKFPVNGRVGILYLLIGTLSLIRNGRQLSSREGRRAWDAASHDCWPQKEPMFSLLRGVSKTSKTQSSTFLYEAYDHAYETYCSDKDCSKLLSDLHKNSTTSALTSRIPLKGSEYSQKPQHGITASRLTSSGTVQVQVVPASLSKSPSKSFATRWIPITCPASTLRMRLSAPGLLPQNRPRN